MGRDPSTVAYVADLARSVAFYRDTLGLLVQASRDDTAIVEPDGWPLLLAGPLAGNQGNASYRSSPAGRSTASAPTSPVLPSGSETPTAAATPSTRVGLGRQDPDRDRPGWLRREFLDIAQPHR
jgi:catechol 2,3-dioxygenase-like lactoylglutathione lyase family enzyme